MAAALALRARGEEVIGCDAGPPDRRLWRGGGKASDAGVEVQLDASGDALAARAGTLIKSPGVPQNAPASARRATVASPCSASSSWPGGCLANEFVAVTGTNGKTTTTEWIGHVHREAGLPVAVAGNVGTAATSLVGGELGRGRTVVCEASSFQLEDTIAFSPEVAVLLNLSPTTSTVTARYEDYVAAKLRIFANQGNDDVAVAPADLGVEDLGGCARRVPFGGRARPGAVRAGRSSVVGRGAAACAVEICAPRRAQRRERDGHRRGVPGARNRCRRGRAPACGRSPASRHRLEPIATQDGVAWVNDSKATNVASTIVALRAIRRAFT